MEKNTGIREMLRQAYNEVCTYCDLQITEDDRNIYGVIKKALSDFVKQCREPAIWCFGRHTKMLMEDFIFELKGIRYIIDNGMECETRGGYEIIHESEITEKCIDGVIISSRIAREQIKNILKKDFKDIHYLDLYDELEKAGIYIEREYYRARHPEEKYCYINELQRRLNEQIGDHARRDTFKQVIRFYIEIKDFHSAVLYAKKLADFHDGIWETGLVECLEQIYRMQIEALKEIDKDHVLMLCIDGLRRQDVCNGKMEKLHNFLTTKTHFFSNAYSLSTSTYESLLPAYSENTDLRTKYYELNRVKGNQCRFIQEAKMQKRQIFFYTDGTDYVSDDAISVTGYPQTVTEKIWCFLLDALAGNKGLFYIHAEFESHFPYPNPYTKEKITIKNWNIMYDYLEREGGCIQHDYCKQQADALKYLDDVLFPLIEKLPCRMILYADHGNILIGKETKLEDVESTKYTFHEDLIQVPLAVKAPEVEIGIDHALISILELNNVIIGLLNQQRITYQNKKEIKVMRSELYNPDFRYLYIKTGNEQCLLAFEVFIFEEGYKLAVYSNGITELYDKDTDCQLDDINTKALLLRQIADQITVCDSRCLKN